MGMLRAFWGCSAGSNAVEYALILAIVGAAIAVAAMTLGVAVSGEVNEAASCVDDPTTC